MEPLKIIARYPDGRMIKGTTANFWPDAPAFHLNRIGDPPGSPAIQVWIQQLKAVFVVQKFEGNPLYHERRQFRPGECSQGEQMQVTFKDGETMVGSVLEYNPGSQGFFLFPPDPQSNNRRIFIVNAAVREAKSLRSSTGRATA